MQIMSCARLTNKAVHTINDVTPHPCINLMNNLSQIFLFPLSWIKSETIPLSNGQYIPLEFQLKTPGFYQIQAIVDKWDSVNDNTWKSKDPVFFRCEMHDTPVGDVTKYYYNFFYNSKNQRFQLNIAPFAISQGRIPLYVFVQSHTRPKIVTIQLADTNNRVQQSILFRPYFIKLNNQQFKNKISVRFIEKKYLVLYMKHVPEQPKKNIQTAPQKQGTTKPKSNMETKMSDKLRPSGILLCRKGYHHIEASVNISDWHKKGNYWQGLMYTFIRNGKKYKGLNYQKNKDRFEFKSCGQHRMGRPLLVNIFSKTCPGKLTFNYQINYQGNYPKFLRFTNLQKYFSLDGKIPSAIISDRENYEYKSTHKIKPCPALILTFFKKHHQLETLKKENPQYINQNEYVSKEPHIRVTRESNNDVHMIQSDHFTNADRLAIPSGIYFHKLGTYLVSASIDSNEWINKNGAWWGRLYTFTGFYDHKNQVSKGLIYKNDVLDGQFQVNFGMNQVAGKPLHILIYSPEKPKALSFQLQKTVRQTGFLAFNEISNAFFIDGKPAAWLNDEQPYKKQPVATLFLPSKRKKATVLNKQSTEKSRIGILPFSTMLTNELSVKLKQSTIQEFHKVVTELFQKQSNITINEVQYSKNTDPFTFELIEIPAPTIEKVVEETPEFILFNICRKHQMDTLLFGHFEENLVENYVRIIIRVFDCKSKTYQSYVKTIEFQNVSEQTVKNAINQLIAEILPRINFTI